MIEPPVTRAVIPAAGLGTRLRPLTLVAPKEMLPLGRKPAVEHIIEELRSVGINDIIFVVSPQKPGLRNYFGVGGGGVSIRYVVQEVQRGLADAILRAEDAVGGERFVVALGDTVILSRREVSPLRRLIGSFLRNRAFAALIVERVPLEDAGRYGIVTPLKRRGDGDFQARDLVEKPAEGESPGDLAIGGRYVFGPEIFEFIRGTEPGALGEVQITDAVKLGVGCGRRVWCSQLLPGERRYDIGDFKTYCEAFAAVCMLDPELAGPVAAGAGVGREF